MENKLTERQREDIMERLLINGELYNTYIKDERNPKLRYDYDWFKLIGLKSSVLIDCTDEELISATNKALKLIFKHDTMSRNDLFELWKKCLWGGEFYHSYLNKIGKHTLQAEKWFDMIGIHIKKGFNYYNQNEILEIYAKAKELAENGCIKETIHFYLGNLISKDEIVQENVSIYVKRITRNEDDVYTETKIVIPNDISELVNENNINVEIVGKLY